jgi:hypothetical protein
MPLQTAFQGGSTMIARREVLRLAGVAGGAYVAGYLTPLGRTAAAWLQKCTPSAPGPPAVRPTQAASPASSRYDFVAVHVTRTASGTTAIWGLVRNNTATPTGLQLVAHYYEGTTLVASVSDLVCLDVVPAYADSPAYLGAHLQVPPDAVARYVVTPDDSHGQWVVPHLSVRSQHYTVDGKGNAQMVGIVRNTGVKLIAFVKLAVAYFERSGALLEYDEAFADSAMLVPGQDSAFAIHVAPVPSGVASYRLYVTGREQAA